MKMKNMVALAMLSLAAFAFGGDSDGNIRGIHAVPDYEQTIIYPNKTAPLKAGQTFYILVRLLNEDWHRKPEETHPWYFRKRGDNMAAAALDEYDQYKPALGISIGGRTEMAAYSTKGPNGEESGPNATCPWYTDLYFAYTVKPGDLGLPIKLLNQKGKITQTVGDNSDYKLYNVNTKGADRMAYWDLTNDMAGEGEARHLAGFHYGPENFDEGDPGYPAEPHPTAHRSFDFAEDGIYVQTIDFDGTYADDTTDPKVWREVHLDGGVEGERPSVVADGDATVYVWSEDDTIAYVEPDGPNTESYDDGTGRKLIKVTVSGGATTFKIRGVGALGSTVRILMSSGTSESYSLVGDKEESSTCVRTVKVIDREKPSLELFTVVAGQETSKPPLTKATVDYENDWMLVTLRSNTDLPAELYPLDVDLDLRVKDVSLDDVNPTNGYVKVLLEEGDPTIQPGTNRVTLAAGREVSFYVYKLGSCKETKSNGILITPKVVGAGAEAFFTGKMTPITIKLDDQEPVIVQPAEGAEFNASEGALIEDFNVEVNDNWRDLQPSLATNGYTVSVSFAGGGSFTTNGVHFLSDTAVALPLVAPNSGSYDAVVKVKDPAGHVSSRTVTINANPKPKAKVQFYADPEMKTPIGGNTFAEGQIPYAGVTFTVGKAPANMYAFLVPQNANATNLVVCDAMTNGLAIAQGETNTTVAAMSFLDGYSTLHPMNAKFKVVFRSVQEYASLADLAADTSSVDYTAECGSPAFEVNAVNVTPTVKPNSMELSGTTVANGGTLGNKAPMGSEVKFTATVQDASPIDLNATNELAILAKWVWTDGIGDEKSEYSLVTTNVKKHVSCPITFGYEGEKQEVRVYLADKDDRAGVESADEIDWGEVKYTFYVNVTASAKVEILGQDQLPAESVSFDETATKSKAFFYVRLSQAPTGYAPGSKPISASNPIKVRFSKDNWGSDGNMDFESETVELTDTKPKKVYLNVDTLNGGADTLYNVYATVITDSCSNQYGVAWSNYYTAASAEMSVINISPTIGSVKRTNGTFTDTGTNRWAAGESVALKWTVKDILPDLTNGMFSLTWSHDPSGDHVNPQSITNVVAGTGRVRSAEGTYEFVVPDVKDQLLTLTVEDGDGGVATKQWVIYVAPTKRISVNVLGPSSASETKYGGALGLGRGAVGAKGTAITPLCESFVQTWSYPETSASAQLYAWGYPSVDMSDPAAVAAALDKGDMPVKAESDATGIPLSSTGAKWMTGREYYNYATMGGINDEAGRFDNYFYRWVIVSTGDKEGGAAEGDEIKPSPTYYPLYNTSKSIALSEGKEGVYGVVEVDAVFSRELREKDNLGDINADGIPDLVVRLYGLGADAVGEFPEDDLDPLRDLNDDEPASDGGPSGDFLPNVSDSSIYSSLIPGLPESWGEGQEFTAIMEVRGAYSDDGVSGLNDAMRLIGLSNHRLEPDFNSDDVEKRKAARDYSELEMLAWAEHGYAKDWSPERPTDPTKADTDGDKFPDGYEYYFWYKAHVGFMENGVHRYLTGRAYDPKNPGEGKLISAEEIAYLMDPLVASGDASSAKTRDTDNDGLPDLLEFEIGTNPFDFDTDGDGLPDGFEIMLGGTDPLLSATTPGVSDAMRNYDGDAMAFTTPAFEKDLVQPTPKVIDDLFTFALVDPQGDTDGIQWYVGKAAPTNIVPLAACVTGTSFRVGGKTYVTRGTVPVVTNVTAGLLSSTTNVIIAADLPKETTWEVAKLESLTNALPSLADVLATTAYVALMPTRIPAGTPIDPKTEVVAETYATLQFANDVKGVNAAWVYGRSVSRVTKGDSLANIGGFGMLAIGRYQDAPAKRQIAALPAKDDGVAYLHHFVYQEFGFDPRTAWNANTPLAPRWGKTVGEGAATEVVANNFAANYSYAGIATRTREYTLYDEFLVLSFFLNNGKLDLADVTATQARPWEKIWSLYTTNGQGPNEPNWEPDNEDYKGRTAETNSGENGCDTDQDGVPDGWELYVMAGPKQGGKYNLVAPYDDGYYSSFGPFVADAAKASVTDNEAKGDYGYMAGDGDGLTELQEFAGTDSCGYYNGYDGAEGFTVYSVGDKAIRRPEEHKQWLNKFFPTDPWNEDTDNDGLKDNEFKGQGGFKCGNFHYGTPVDDGKSCCIPGGGLNPCTVDTDMDGLPDPWEAQFAGEKIYTGDDAQIMTGRDGTAGNPLQGLCDGMDGTVFDAFNTPHKNYTTGAETETEVVILNGTAQVVDRDYDHDGLDNWQEYLTGAMRCWRYDDPLTRWDAIPDAAYYDEFGQFDISRAILWAKEAAPGEDISDANAFWYATLIDSSSAIYNPHLLTGMTPCAQYFTRIENGWDQVYGNGETYYLFHDRFDWGYMAKPRKYACCSPLKADTDQDGMDDYWELFHGLNPLLGESGVLEDSDGPCDIVFDAWYDGVSSPVSALVNRWFAANPGNGDYDFTVHPWLNGLAAADPDGDDIRNQDESIMPLVAPSATWYHTDPTPLWMTDSSYSNSLVRLFFRMPVRFNAIPGVPESVTDPKGREIPLVEFQGYSKGKILAFTPDYWTVSLPGYDNWAYSFEENEGYDTDHDSTSDFEELQGKVRSKTDPQDADSPRRRQAMHFGGPANPSALQSMPFVAEAYPRATLGYPDDMSFLQYTVECWVKPESTADATVIERTSFVDPSHCADERYVRRNFRLAIRDGRWHASFDANGTLDGSTVEVLGKTDAAANAWTYVAATYDANRLTLYVNGREDGYVMSSLKPEYGSSAVVVYPGDGTTMSTNGVMTGDIEAAKGEPRTYWFDREYSLHAFLLGASFSDSTDDRYSLNVMNGRGWRGYHDFFTGCIDEVRVWDGARSAEDIAADYAGRKRYTREDAIANRSAFYKQWVAGERRYGKDPTTGKDAAVVPELRFHWAFDSIPGAENAAAVAQAPHGFLDVLKPVWSAPEGYAIPWWSTVVAGYGSVYAGNLNWVPWIPNTVTHLPRFDGTTLDSAYWSEDYAGDEPGTYPFARTAEPVSKWTQMIRNATAKVTEFRSTSRRFWLSYNTGTNATSSLAALFEFTGRHLNQVGDDLLPLGGAFVKYVDAMWDDQGASSMWEQTGKDADADGLPDWWQEYAAQNYREGVPEGEDITWNTMIWYEVGGVKIRMTAGEAYLRDLAKGAYVDANGEFHVGLTPYVQTADEDANGMPDWWAEMYHIRGESGLADHDNDGLPNYVEYLLSEVFAFKTIFDPTVPDSVQRGIPDYFYRPEGCQLYVGEIFTDHDRMYDTWEDQYPVGQLSRLAFDAYGDPDGDGWANVSEMLAGTDPTRTRSLGVEDQVLAEYPVPMIRTRVKIPDHLPESTPIVVQAFSKSIDGKPDAIWRTGASEGSLAKEKVVGLNPGVVRHYYLNPGSITPASFRLEFKDPTFKHLTETKVNGRVTETSTINGNTDVAFWQQRVNDLAHEDGKRGDLVNTANGEKVGWIDYVTGEVEIDFSKLQDSIRVIMDTQTSSSGASAGGAQVAQTVTTTLYHLIDMSVSYAKLSWSAKLVKQGSKSELYLSDADEGYVREGKNAFIAWADIDGSGTWQPGEPYGIVRDVDVSWSGTTAEIELTDISPVTPRIVLAGSAEGSEQKTESKKEEGEETAGDPDELDPASDRGRTISSIKARMREQLEYDYSGASPVLYSNALERLNWMNIDVLEPAQLASGEFREQRIRVVRWLVNDRPAYDAGASMRTVLDKRIRTDLKTSLTEADFLVGNENVFDLDWEHLYDEVINNISVSLKCGEVTRVSYLVVVGDGPADWSTISSSNYTVRALNSVIVRKFGEERVTPVAVAPGAVSEEIVHGANPTFKWMMDCPEDEGYTAFNVQVMDGSTLVYDSDKQLAPPRNAEGQYVWTAPLYVGDKTLKGKVFENKRAYTWKVSMYNAKYSNGAVYSNAGKFLMEVQTNGYEYGTANVAVRYFGPKSSYSKSYQKKDVVIRVRAYTSPDFTGVPVAAGYVANPDDPANGLTAGTNAAPNCTVIGIPRGTYYLQAFIDSNANGACDPWETQGYLCTRDGTTSEYLDPTAITFDSKVGKGDLAVIYLEDADTDADGLPDAWEYAEYGSLTAKGVELLTETKAGEFVVNTAISGALKLQENALVPTAGLAGRLAGTALMSNAGVLALAMGADTEGYDSFAAAISGFVSPELVEDGVRIASLDLVNGKVSIKVEAETETAGSAWVKGRKELTVWCQVQWKQSLTNTDWLPLGDPFEITVGTEEAAEIDISDRVPEGDSGYFSVKVYKK